MIRDIIKNQTISTEIIRKEGIMIINLNKTIRLITIIIIFNLGKIRIVSSNLISKNIMKMDFNLMEKGNNIKETISKIIEENNSDKKQLDINDIEVEY